MLNIFAELYIMSLTNIPCVIVHTGYKPYLKYNLEITSKNNQVYLIGDSSLKKLEDINNNIQFIDIKKYEESIITKKYKNCFINYSSQPSDLEWMNFKRVFIMHQFLYENNLETIFHMDSDNVLLRDINSFEFVSKNAYCIPSFQENFRMDSSIHCGLLDITFFQAYRNLYEDLYLNKSKLNLIQEKIDHHKLNNIRGGITDMTLYFLMQKLELIMPQNLMEPIENKDSNKYIFLNNINLAEGYMSKQNFEINRKGRVKIYNGNSVNDLIENKIVRIANIHFQGSAKKQLNRFTKYRLSY